MNKYFLSVTVFTTGAIVMVLEIVGSRIVAPYLGTSLIIWTSLIGVILASLSLGYWLGGTLGDIRASRAILSLILLAAALLVATCALLSGPALSWSVKHVQDLRLGSVLSTSILFAPPSVLLGMVSPYAIRLLLKDISRAGSVVGSLYAISTVGSIVGTFLAGFWLIPQFGSAKILYILVGVLIGLAFVVGFPSFSVIQRAFVLALVPIGLLPMFRVGSMNPTVVADVDTHYNRVIVYDVRDPVSGRPIRVLVTGISEQSRMFLYGDDDLVQGYAKFYRLGRHFVPVIRRALMVGGGGYSYPKDFLRHNAGAQMDSIELDPVVTKLSKMYLNFPEDPRLKVHHGDARIFLNRATSVYDAIYVDVFSASCAIPFHLVTREAMTLMRDALREPGVMLLNVITSIESRLLGAIYVTSASVFPFVYVFPVNHVDDTQIVQNILVVGVKDVAPPPLRSADPELQRYLYHRWKGKMSVNVPLLTDDFAPLEQYYLEAVKKDRSVKGR